MVNTKSRVISLEVKKTIRSNQHYKEHYQTKWYDMDNDEIIDKPRHIFIKNNLGSLALAKANEETWESYTRFTLNEMLNETRADERAKIVEMLKKEAITARKIDMIDRSGYQEFCRDIIQKINEMETSSKEVSSRTGKWNEKTGLFE